MNLPLEIPFRGELVLRGEAVISYSDFQKINDEIVFLEALYGIQDVLLRYQIVLHGLEALLLQETELRLHGISPDIRIPGISFSGIHQRKGVEPDISPGRNLIVQLAHGDQAP